MEDISLGAGGGGRSLQLTLGPGRGKFTYFQLHKKVNAPVNPEGVAGASNDWTDAVIPFSSHGKMTNKIQICFSK